MIMPTQLLTILGLKITLVILVMNFVTKTFLHYQMLELNPSENSHYMPLPMNGIISVKILGYSKIELPLK